MLDRFGQILKDLTMNMILFVVVSFYNRTVQMIQGNLKLYLFMLSNAAVCVSKLHVT